VKFYFFVTFFGFFASFFILLSPRPIFFYYELTLEQDGRLLGDYLFWFLFILLLRMISLSHVRIVIY